MFISKDQLFGLDIDKEYENSAKNRRELSHYSSSIENIYNMLSTDMWVANCITEYKSIYNETLSYSKSNAKILFSISFSSDSDNAKMWKYFANYGKGALMVLKYENDFCQTLLNKKKLIKAYFNNKTSHKKYYKCKFTWINSYDNKYDCDYLNNKMEKFVLDYRLIDVNYCKSNYVKSSELLTRLIINSPIYLNDTEKFQKETRLSLFLRSTIDIKTSYFNELHIPINFNDFSEIIIVFGKKMIDKNIWREKINKLAEEKKLNIIIE